MSKHYAFFGGYANQYWLSVMEPMLIGTCEGITTCEVNPETGEMKVIHKTTGDVSPATLVLSPDHKYLYAANELNNWKGRAFGGGLTAYKINDDGSLDKINDAFAAGSCTAYVTIDKTGKYVFVANHGSYFATSRYEIKDGEVIPTPVFDEGCVCMYEVREDGGIGKLLDRKIVRGTFQDPISHGSGHPHSIVISDDDFIVVPDKGGDAVYVYKLDRENNKMVEMSLYESGVDSCPRHAFFIKGTDYVLVQNEFDGHLCSYSLNRETGELALVNKLDTADPSLMSEGMSFQSHPWGCDVQVHPNNRFVYSSNSTQNTVIQFNLDPNTGILSFVKFYHTDIKSMVRGIQVSPDGKFLTATGVSDNKALIYKICPECGELTLVSEIALDTPTALRYLYED